MPIFFSASAKTFHLQGKNASYVMQILDDGRLCHLYYGAALPKEQALAYLLRSCTTGFSVDGVLSESVVPMEYPAFGTGDLRVPCLNAQNDQGQYCADLRYVSHTIQQGKPKLNGLPSTFGDASSCETLSIVCRDDTLGLEANLFYSVFTNHNAIARHVEFFNTSATPVTLCSALSGSLSLPDMNFDMITFNGAWARERHMHRAPLHPGRQGIFSQSGGSGHVHNPLVVLQRTNGGESYADTYMANLVYSGNFTATVEVSHMNTVRLVMGVDTDTCSFKLLANEKLVMPELVLSYAQNGTGELTRETHDFYREHLVRKNPFDKRPVLINNWEATYCNFTQKTLERIMRDAAAININLFVLDDGWFGKRNDDTTSLGDWVVNKEKLPDGIAGLETAARANDLKLGLWLEPESISEDSDLYRAHPDWCMHIENRSRTNSRHQLLADITRPEVRNAIYEQIKAVLSSVPICYIKWDMNRPFTEPGGNGQAQQSRYTYEYMLAIYDLLEQLCTDFPQILLEGCSAGGARFDPGMLYYCPQIWASDNTDASERLDIQIGTAFAYPVSTIGAHVSIVPNHQTGRVIPLNTRFAVALCGTFGYELDPAQLSDEEITKIPQQIDFFNRHESLIANGDYYRYISPQNDGDDCCFGFVSKDKQHALVLYVQRYCHANMLPKNILLQGFEPDAIYCEETTGLTYTGATLCHAGYPLGKLEGDFVSSILVFDAI